MKLLKEKAAKAMKALKALTPEDVKSLYLVILFAVIVLIAFAAIIHRLAVLCETLLIIALLLSLAGTIFIVVFYRCPHCGKHLGRSGGKYCPYCGKELNK